MQFEEEEKKSPILSQLGNRESSQRGEMTSLGKSDIDTPESLSSEMSEDAEIDQ